jgi:hypothetical protein
MQKSRNLSQTFFLGLSGGTEAVVLEFLIHCKSVEFVDYSAEFEMEIKGRSKGRSLTGRTGRLSMYKEPTRSSYSCNVCIGVLAAAAASRGNEDIQTSQY